MPRSGGIRDECIRTLPVHKVQSSGLVTLLVNPLTGETHNLVNLRQFGKNGQSRAGSLIEAVQRNRTRVKATVRASLGNDENSHFVVSLSAVVVVGSSEPYRLGFVNPRR